MAGPSIICFSSGMAEVFITDLPTFPLRSFKPPVDEKGLSWVLMIESSPEFLGNLLHDIFFSITDSF